MRSRARAAVIGSLTALWLLCAGGTAASAEAQISDAPPKRILILYDENKDDLPGLSRTDRSLRESFRSALGKVEIYSESMGLSRPEPAGYESLVADFLRSKYAGLKPDLIVAVMERPLDFLLRQRDALFPGVPIVFAGIDASTIAGRRLPAGVTGVFVERDYSRTLDVALHLQPGTRNVFVVGGASPFDRRLQSFLLRDLKPFERRISMNYLFGMPMDALLKRLSALPPHSIVLYLSVLTDGAERRFVPADALQSIAASANAPVYVFLDQYVGLGAVGGSVYSFATHGSQVAALGVRILRGVSPDSLPPRALSAQIHLFDDRQLKRWKVDASRLPPGSEVRYRDLSVWVVYRWYILTAIAVLVVQGLLIGGLIVARARQRRAEAEARRQRDDLAHVLRKTTISELATSLAHEISQPLSAILLNAQSASRSLKNGGDANEMLADIVSDARRASSVIGRLRGMFHRRPFEPAVVEARKIIDDVVRLSHSAMLLSGIDMRIAIDDDAPPVRGDIVQLEQVLLNVVVNACDAVGTAWDGPRTVAIRARRAESGGLLIEVDDTGVGIAESDLERIFEHFVSSKANGMGMGLSISRTIVRDHGGRIWATANAGRGATMHIELPAAGNAAHSIRVHSVGYK